MQAQYDYEAHTVLQVCITYDAIMRFKHITIPCNGQALLCICHYHDSLQECQFDHVSKGLKYIFAVHFPALQSMRCLTSSFLKYLSFRQSFANSTAARVNCPAT